MYSRSKLGFLLDAEVKGPVCRMGREMRSCVISTVSAGQIGSHVGWSELTETTAKVVKTADGTYLGLQEDAALLFAPHLGPFSLGHLLLGDGDLWDQKRSQNAQSRPPDTTQTPQRKDLGKAESSNSETWVRGT